ncbi:MAG TPA: ornithine carbamoyltransferase [Candidatus Limnocylindrales bacterium]|nr:ornithine carbamoyltransferase [Candidatus Limnocylindrales bacterium]
MKRDLVTLRDLSREEILHLVALARRMKDDVRNRRPHRWLTGRTLAMIFEKPSLRTRVTFETGMYQLGGDAIYLAPGDIQLGTREPVSDIAANLSRWVDVIVARTFSHKSVVDLAQNSTVPVINGLSDLYHPCQVLADVLTLIELRENTEGLKVAFVGDGNNMVHSWLLATVKLGFDFRLACPAGYEPDADILAEAEAAAPGRILITHDVAAAVKGADVLYTDVWTSMGQEVEAERRRKAFARYQINDAVVAKAASDAVVMHCLPAHRGEEITASVIDGPRSIVLEQAENRLHIQKAILAWLVGTEEAR